VFDSSIIARDDFSSEDYSNIEEISSLKTVNGKFYAYIVLLFNENPHFVNLIQKDSIPLKFIGNEGFNVKAYKNYMGNIKNTNIKKIALKMFKIYIEPDNVKDKKLNKLEKILGKRNVILKFGRERNNGRNRIILDYCIFGRKISLTVKHPFFKIDEKIYNIQPFIYYDEFLTSNSTFYYDMIYINPEEVRNDFIIATKVMNGETVDSMFFVGSPVTADIKYCIKKAFQDRVNIKKKILDMFVIHELTHKVLNNKYINVDQVTGEELSLCSTIYESPYLGISVMYSYLNYNSINPHRIAALNFLKFIAEKTANAVVINDPGEVKTHTQGKIKGFAKEYFEKSILQLRVRVNNNRSH